MGSKGHTRWLANLALLIAALLFCEASLRILTLVSPRLDALLSPGEGVPMGVPDKVNGVRPNPDFFEHDRWGYRNKAVPESADVVVFGDSQTYGSGVSPDEAWPRLFEAKLGRPVYNISFGGWGPTQSLALWGQAERLRPKLVIEAFYLGNDLYDCYEMVYARGQLPGLKTKNPDVLRRITEAEKAGNLSAKATDLFLLGDKRQGDQAKVKGGARSAGLRQRAVATIKKARLYALLKAIYKAVGTNTKGSVNARYWGSTKGFASTKPGYLLVVDCDKVKTVLQPSYRLCALDQTDPRIREGRDMAVKAMLALRDKAEASGARFAVLIIPTKEYVVYPYYVGTGGGDPGYARLVNNEVEVTAYVKEALKTNGIAFMDASGVMRESIDRGVLPYRMDWDGHPNPEGHKAIAGFVASEIKARRLLNTY